MIENVLRFFGVENVDSQWYAFWSGVGSDIGEVALLGVVAGAWHHHNCHEPRCWRISRHTITDADGVTHGACRKHRVHVLNRVTEAPDGRS